MSILWNRRQRERVTALMDAYPARSGECAALARALLPVAWERDRGAEGLLIRPRPGYGVYVVPRVGEVMWFHHVAVGTEEHVLDALTGGVGTPRAEYLEAHWEYPDELSVDPDDLADPCL